MIWSSRFVVNSTTGDIFVSVNAAINSTLLDYETDPVFSIMVEAHSGDLQAFAEIAIYLSDRNDNPPVMISSVFYASLQENNDSFLFPVFVKVNNWVTASSSCEIQVKISKKINTSILWIYLEVLSCSVMEF